MRAGFLLEFFTAELYSWILEAPMSTLGNPPLVRPSSLGEAVFASLAVLQVALVCALALPAHGGLVAALVVGAGLAAAGAWWLDRCSHREAVLRSLEVRGKLLQQRLPMPTDHRWGAARVLLTHVARDEGRLGHLAARVEHTLQEELRALENLRAVARAEEALGLSGQPAALERLVARRDARVEALLAAVGRLSRELELAQLDQEPPGLQDLEQAAAQVSSCREVEACVRSSEEPLEVRRRRARTAHMARA